MDATRDDAADYGEVTLRRAETLRRLVAWAFQAVEGPHCEIAHELSPQGATLDFYCVDDAFHDEDKVQAVIDRLVADNVPIVPDTMPTTLEWGGRPRPLACAGEIGPVSVDLRRYRRHIVRVRATARIELNPPNARTTAP